MPSESGWDAQLGQRSWERPGDFPGQEDRHAVSLHVQNGLGSEWGGSGRHGGQAQPGGTYKEWPEGSFVAPKSLGASGDIICKVRNEERDCTTSGPQARSVVSFKERGVFCFCFGFSL